MSDNSVKQPFSITQDTKISSHTPLPTLSTVISVIAIIFLIYAFFSGLSYQFYASFVFFFYSFTHSMWISVVMLGIFQTLLFIPIRMIRVIRSDNTKEFQRNVEKMNDMKQQSFVLKSHFHQGDPTFLFYAVDFVIQLVSYISIGRLFLTDFYANHISPKVLYSWVPYPDYPIVDTFFKIPYPQITKAVDFGWKVVIPVWIVLVVVQMALIVVRRAVRQQKGAETAKNLFSGRLTRYTAGYLLFFMLVAYILVRHFPVGWTIRIFSGDVSIPNPTFNTITAIATFLVLIYHSVPRIVRKGRLAERLGVSQKVIDKTQLEMFRETLMSAAFVGLGAFYITNQIPSAFELSIFTLEVISLAAPFTIDKLVLKGIPGAGKEGDEDTIEDVIHEFGLDDQISEEEAKKLDESEKPQAQPTEEKPVSPEETAK